MPTLKKQEADQLWHHPQAKPVLQSVREEKTLADTQTSVTREEALAAIARLQAVWDDLVARVGAGRMDVPGAMGEWTFKDLADHLTVWDHHELARVRAAFTGEPEPAPPWAGEANGDDEIKAWIQAKTQTSSDTTVLAEAHALFDDFAALAAPSCQTPGPGARPTPEFLTVCRADRSQPARPLGSCRSEASPVTLASLRQSCP